MTSEPADFIIVQEKKKRNYSAGNMQLWHRGIFHTSQRVINKMCQAVTPLKYKNVERLMRSTTMNSKLQI